MADTRGLLSTRDAYNEAVTEGKTGKSHKDWYEEQQRAQQPAAEETPYNARWCNQPLSREEQ